MATESAHWQWGKRYLHANAFSFDPIFVKLAGNRDRHKILDEFKFQPDRTTPFEVILIKASGQNIDKRVNSLVLIGSLWKLQITWTGIKSQMSSDLDKIALFILELLAIECQKKTIFIFVWSIACVIFIRSLWNLQINRIGIKYSTSWKLDHIALLTVELHALDCWHVGSQVSDYCPLGNLFSSLSFSPNSLIQKSWDVVAQPHCTHLSHVMRRLS